MRSVRAVGVVMLSVPLGLANAVIVGVAYSETLTIVTWPPVAVLLGIGLGSEGEGLGPRTRVISLCLVALAIGYGWIALLYGYRVCDRVSCV